MRWAIVLGLIASGCASQGLRMRAAPAPATTCESDAYVVFVRPTSGGTTIEVREADGTLLGQLGDRSYFGVAVAPGEHFFVAESDLAGTRPVGLKAELGAGATYYVDVELFKPLRQAALYALAERIPYWKDLPGWLAGSHRVELDPARGVAPVPADWERTYSYALQWWSMLDQESAFDRVLILSDGEPQETAPGTPRPAACVGRAAKPSHPVAMVAGVAHDVDLPQCWLEKPTGSNMRQLMCASERVLADRRQDSWWWIIQPRANSK